MSLPARVLPCTVRNEWRPGFDDRPMEPTGLPIDCQIPSITAEMEPPGSSVATAATAHVIHPYSTWVCGRALRVEGFTPLAATAWAIVSVRGEGSRIWNL
jgi:hypothetical protein